MLLGLGGVRGKYPAESKAKVPVSMRALLQRINRKLKHEGRAGQMLRTARTWTNDLGNYYAIDFDSNLIIAQHVDPETWGREMGVLRPWEELRDDCKN